MAVIVEDGSGMATANSYVSEAEYIAYHDARGNYAAQAGEVGTALIRATAYIDSAYRGRFPGLPRFPRAQALEWPRVDVVDLYGYSVPIDSVPREIKMATMEAAAREVATPGGLAPDFVAAQQVTREQIGQLSVSYSEANTVDAVTPVVPIIARLLSPILMPSSGGYVGRAVRG